MLEWIMAITVMIMMPLCCGAVDDQPVNRLAVASARREGIQENTVRALRSVENDPCSCTDAVLSRDGRKQEHPDPRPRLFSPEACGSSHRRRTVVEYGTGGWCRQPALLVSLTECRAYSLCGGRVFHTRFLVLRLKFVEGIGIM